MNPTFLDDEAPKPAATGRWRRLGNLVGRCARILFTNLFRRRQPQFRNEVGTPLSRFIRGLLYRLVFVPLMLAIIVLVMVVTSTHPHCVSITADPSTLGIYFDPVEFVSADQTRLEGWLVPVVDARRVLVEREDLLHKRYPAVILVHDYANSRQQLLPLVAPFHEAGYVVLAISLRGNSPGGKIASTFGLNESMDVRAAVDMLRRRPFVDPDSIGLLGVGTGATASLLAAQQDPRLRVLILDHPIKQFDDLLASRIGPQQQWLAWMRPMCKWGFEIGFKVNADDVNLTRFSKLMSNAQVLMLDDPTETYSFGRPVRQGQIVDFLKHHLVARSPAITLAPAPGNTKLLPPPILKELPSASSPARPAPSNSEQSTTRE